MTPADAMERCHTVLAHLWMVRTFHRWASTVWHRSIASAGVMAAQLGRAVDDGGAAFGSADSVSSFE